MILPKYMDTITWDWADLMHLAFSGLNTCWCFGSFVQGRQLMWVLVSFNVHQVPFDPIRSKFVRFRVGVFRRETNTISWSCLPWKNISVSFNCSIGILCDRETSNQTLKNDWNVKFNYYSNSCKVLATCIFVKLQRLIQHYFSHAVVYQRVGKREKMDKKKQLKNSLIPHLLIVAFPGYLHCCSRKCIQMTESLKTIWMTHQASFCSTIK